MEITELDILYQTSRGSLVSKCKLKDGQKVYMLLDSFEYDKFPGAKTEWFGSTLTYTDLSFNEPVIVHGKIRDADDLRITGLKSAINSPTIVVFLSLDK